MERGKRLYLWTVLMQYAVVSPLSLLKSPMVLIGIVGLAFVMGVPYLLENSTFSPPSTHSFWAGGHPFPVPHSTHSSGRVGGEQSEPPQNF